MTHERLNAIIQAAVQEAYDLGRAHERRAGFVAAMQHIQALNQPRRPVARLVSISATDPTQCK